MHEILPWVLSNVLPHGEEYGCCDEWVLDDEGVKVGGRVVHDVAHDRGAAAGEVVSKVDHALAVQGVIYNRMNNEWRSMSTLTHKKMFNMLVGYWVNENVLSLWYIWNGDLFLLCLLINLGRKRDRVALTRKTGMSTRIFPISRLPHKTYTCPKVSGRKFKEFEKEIK